LWGYITSLRITLK
jgi:hypothetical protein